MGQCGINKAYFYFNGNLQDFRPKRLRGAAFVYTFRGAPTVKDALEALGVPHPEVDVILVNQKPVLFRYRLQAEDSVEVHPFEPSRQWPAGFSFEEAHPPPNQFILDVHLGTLAKSMRMLGLDVIYETNFTDKAIASLAAEQQRIVLTRDIGLLKQKNITWGYWLRSQQTEAQVAEVIARFNLQPHFKPLSRCLSCNLPLREVEKREVLNLLPPKTKLYFKEFHQCPACLRVYWKGSYYERMRQYISQIST
ncbi:Mut7-C RNAse domain-containing protein [Pontibacter oryzae]|uniref:Twitching motility protein PilT n=1 Tax=Pontibacter oryzae TaxID=2304593 RepID=A0A399SGL5_9BACT|nr:Mut7-C RNAse domain-containing protein [Pontibacter oryzae]RIJ42348.1 hypothetical protein D1627_00290 [Pontibacter oryzae]